MIDMSNLSGELSTNRNDRVLIIDGLNTYIRVFSTVPTIAENGDHVGGIIGFLRSIALGIRDFNATRCILIFDGKGGSLRRRKMYSDYKMNRTNKFNLRRDGAMTYEEEQASMKRQMVRLLQYLECLPVEIMCLDHVEADDVIAYLATQSFTNSKKVRIISTDRDFLQLVNDRVEVYSPVKKKLYTKDELKEEYGIIAENYLLYRIFSGDISDNIPGFGGVGLKTLIKSFPNITEHPVKIDDVYNKCEEEIKVKKHKKIYKSIINNKDIISRNYELMQLSEPNIGGNTTLRIIELLEMPGQKLNASKFKSMLYLDKIFAFKDVDSWLLKSFNGLQSWIR